MSLLLDAGALIAFERGNRTVHAFLERAVRSGVSVRTTTAVIAQVWRRPSAQAKLSRLLLGVEEVPLGSDRGRRTGILLGRAKLADVADGSLIETANDGDEVLTSDADDLVRLAEAAEKTLIITPI